MTPPPTVVPRTSAEAALAAWQGSRVLVVGESILDAYLTGHVERLCREAPVPILDLDARADAAGGAANTAANVRSLGGEPLFVSVVGADDEGERVRAALAGVGIDEDGLIVSGSRRTLSKQRLLAGEQMLLRFDSGTTAALDRADEAALLAALRSAHASADAVLISDYGYGVVTDAVRATLHELQRERALPLIVDARDLRRYRALRPTAVKPNYAEAIRLLGEPELHDPAARPTQVGAAGARLLELTGASIVALTVDRDGAVAFEAGRPPYRTYARPAASSRAAGAGDTFAAVLALGLSVGLDAPALVDLASAACGIVVTRDGTSTCSARELAAVLATVRGKRVDGPAALEARIARERAAGHRIVFTNGVFDILHRGHVTYLNRAKALGDVLVVAVNDDASVRRLKGNDRPINALDDRLGVLEALSCVDLVVPFADPTPIPLIEAARPDVFVKGGDYTRERLPEAPIVERLGGEVRLLPYVADHSTTAIVHRVRGTDVDGAAPRSRPDPAMAATPATPATTSTAARARRRAASAETVSAARRATARSR
jgi:D-beta-D-heptose 7-phosphate kinase/D-beta-D-heptose 1-phosphate adenosyltransferase